MKPWIHIMTVKQKTFIAVSVKHSRNNVLSHTCSLLHVPVIPLLNKLSESLEFVRGKQGNLISVTSAGESNKGDTSGACLMIIPFCLFQLGWSLLSLSLFCCCCSFPLSESISLSFYLWASHSLLGGFSFYRCSIDTHNWYQNVVFSSTFIYSM